MSKMQFVMNQHELCMILYWVHGMALDSDQHSLAVWSALVEESGAVQ